MAQQLIHLVEMSQMERVALERGISMALGDIDFFEQGAGTRAIELETTQGKVHVEVTLSEPSANIGIMIRWKGNVDLTGMYPVLHLDFYGKDENYIGYTGRILKPVSSSGDEYTAVGIIVEAEDVAVFFNLMEDED